MDLDLDLDPRLDLDSDTRETAGGDAIQDQPGNQLLEETPAEIHVKSFFDQLAELEQNMQIQIPDQVKNILELTGYDSLYMVSTINEAVIAEMEISLKEDLYKVLNTEQMQRVYGIYKEKPESFKMLPGHKHLLLKLPDVIKNLQKKHGKKVNLSIQTRAVSNIKPSNTYENKTQTLREANLTEENAQIWTNLKKWAKGKSSCDYWDILSQQFDNVKVVCAVKNNELSCVVNCFCGVSRQLQKLSKSPSQPKRWIYANFHKHWLEKHLSIPENELKEVTKKTTVPITSFFKTSVKSCVADKCSSEDPSKIKIISDIKLSSARPSNEVLTATRALSTASTSNCFIEEEEQLRAGSQNNSSEDGCANNDSTSVVTNSKTSVEMSSKWASLKYQRSERKRRNREKFNIGDQKLITDYYSLAGKICEVLKAFPESKETTSFLEIAGYNIKKAHDNSDLDDHHSNNDENAMYFLKQMLKFSTQNNKLPNNKNSYDKAIKDFALYLYYIGGRLLYETLQSNLKNSMPSISTLNRHIDHKKLKKEGIIDFEGLATFLDKHKLPPLVWISEDATRITGKIEYDPATNKVIGFVLPSKNGLFLTDSYIATSAKTIQSYFDSAPKANFVHVVMAQPLKFKAPSFCLCLFGTDNKYKTEDVLDRWKYLISEAKKYGITIAGFASDGDPKLLKAMKITCDFPSHHDKLLDWPWFHMGTGFGRECCFQDTVHILTKMRTRLLKPGIVLPIGDLNITVEHLKQLISTLTKDKHLLTLSDLLPEDKMNFQSAQKISSNLVLGLLETIPDSKGTASYLKLMHYIETSFLEKSLDLETRIYRIWYCVFFLRIWKAWLKGNKQYSLSNNFLSSNCYMCIEINAHNLLKFVCNFKKYPEYESDMFLLENCTSQTCEKLFRSARSMTSTFSTVINFSINNFLQRIARIETLQLIKQNLSENFLFPREKYNSSEVTFERDFHIDIQSVVLRSLSDAKLGIAALGITGIEESHFMDIDVSIRQKGYGTQNDIDNEDISINNDYEYYVDQNVIKMDINEEEDTFPSMFPEYDINANINDTNEHESEVESVKNDIGSNLKDYSAKIKTVSVKCPFVEIKLEDKTAVVKKSAWCWLLDQNGGKISSDRLRRFIVSDRLKLRSKRTKNPQTTIKSNKKIKTTRTIEPSALIESKSSTSSDSESDSQDRAQDSLQQSLPNDNMSSEEENARENVSDSAMSTPFQIEKTPELAIKEGRDLDIVLEKYYAVFYEKRFYIGRAIEDDKKGNIKLKFLQEELGVYKWPRRDDVDNVHKNRILFGPITLSGNYPFQLKRSDLLSIKSKFNKFKMTTEV